MKRNGFTLIELLAVIVILAIIALIATPIILGIINDAREESEKRSVELYASAVRNGLAAYQLIEGKEFATGAYKSSDLDFIEYDGDVVCNTIEIYKDGKIYVANCTVNGVLIKYTYGTKQIEKGKLSSVCIPAEEQYFATQPLEAGYKYECKVDPNKDSYTFYVLTSVTDPNVKSVNLIMDSNIRKNGTAVKETELTDKGFVSWITKGDYTSEEIGGTEEQWGTYGNTDKGAISAMNHLQTATAEWTNVNTQTIETFTDDSGATHKMAKTYTVNARLPYYSEVSDYKANANNAYLYDNLTVECLDSSWEFVSCDADDIDMRNGVFVEEIEHISNVRGYWLLSSQTSYSHNAWAIIFLGRRDSSMGGAIGNTGVRPVITLDI